MSFKPSVKIEGAIIGEGEHRDCEEMISEN